VCGGETKTQNAAFCVFQTRSFRFSFSEITWFSGFLNFVKFEIGVRVSGLARGGFGVIRRESVRLWHGLIGAGICAVLDGAWRVEGVCCLRLWSVDGNGCLLMEEMEAMLMQLTFVCECAFMYYHFQNTFPMFVNNFVFIFIF
jgi:hypothetical protein